jgi:hypothetical protein
MAGNISILPKSNSTSYYRCKDQIYFTWNQTINEFHEIFQAPDFAIDIQIDFKIQFLNILYWHVSSERLDQ